MVKLTNEILKNWSEEKIALVTINTILKAELKLNIEELKFIVHVFLLVKACVEH
jgi:hypothetical protein